MGSDEQTLIEGFEFLCNQARLIAMLPLEEWRSALNRAESIGPFIDPTLFIQYNNSSKPRILKDVIDAAIALKRVVLKHQPEVAKEREHVLDVTTDRVLDVLESPDGFNGDKFESI